MVTPRDEVVAKLRQIEEHVAVLLAQSPEKLSAERLRLIAGLAGYLRTHVGLHWPAQDIETRPCAVSR